MKFFVPILKEGADPEKNYQGMKKFVEAQGYGKILDKRIFCIRFKHDGDEFLAKVGEYEPHDGRFFKDYIHAIFETGHMYFACSLRRGLMPGSELPIHIGKHDVLSIEYFESC